MALAPIKTFGNTLANSKASVWMWSLWCAIVFALLVVFSDRQLRDVLFGLLFALILFSLFGSTLLFRLQFDADTVSHLFLGRFPISRKPVSDLARVDIGKGVGAKLTFLDGSSIRFLGADVRILRDMCRYIEELRPGQVEVRCNSTIAALLALDQTQRKDA